LISPEYRAPEEGDQLLPGKLSVTPQSRSPSPALVAIAFSRVPFIGTTGNRRIAEAFGQDGRRGASASSARRGGARRSLRKLLTTLCSASSLPRRVALATEQVLERIEVPAHIIDVGLERRQVLFRAIEVASQRRQCLEKGIPLDARIATSVPQPAAQGAVGNADAIRGAPDAAVARDSADEELGQRRGWDDDTLRR
jgi:hypothetical protein